MRSLLIEACLRKQLPLTTLPHMANIQPSKITPNEPTINIQTSIHTETNTRRWRYTHKDTNANTFLMARWVCNRIALCACSVVCVCVCVCCEVYVTCVWCMYVYVCVFMFMSGYVRVVFIHMWVVNIEFVRTNKKNNIHGTTQTEKKKHIKTLERRLKTTCLITILIHLTNHKIAHFYSLKGFKNHQVLTLGSDWI